MAGHTLDASQSIFCRFSSSHCMPSFSHLTEAATEVFDILFFSPFPRLFISQAGEEKQEAGHLRVQSNSIFQFGRYLAENFSVKTMDPGYFWCLVS